MTPRRLGKGVFWLAVLFMAACAKEEAPPPVPVPVQPAPGKPVGGGEKIEVPSLFTAQKDEYFYNPVGKRDPFKEYVGEPVKEEIAASRVPLEQYDLDELVLTGIVWGISDPRALIRAPDGYSYIVKTNSRIGKNRGRVSRITRRQVFVEEEYRDPTGKLVVRESDFEIRPKERKQKVGLQLRMSDE